MIMMMREWISMVMMVIKPNQEMIDVGNLVQ